MPSAVIDYAAAEPIVRSFLFDEINLPFLTDLTAQQLNLLYARLNWYKPATDNQEELRQKALLLAWILRKFPILKNPCKNMQTKALLQASIYSEVSTSSQQMQQRAASQSHVHPYQEDQQSESITPITTCKSARYSPTTIRTNYIKIDDDDDNDDSDIEDNHSIAAFSDRATSSLSPDHIGVAAQEMISEQSTFSHLGQEYEQHGLHTDHHTPPATSTPYRVQCDTAPPSALHSGAVEAVSGTASSPASLSFAGHCANDQGPSLISTARLLSSPSTSTYPNNGLLPATCELLIPTLKTAYDTVLSKVRLGKVDEALVDLAKIIAILVAAKQVVENATNDEDTGGVHI